jgi:formylglycine-generating enzyme required for sulfatase activity
MTDDQSDTRDELGKIEAALKAQEALRGILLDDQLNPFISSLRAKQITLLAQLQGSGATVQGQDAKGAGERGVVADNISGPVITGDNNSVTYFVHQYLAKVGQLLDQEVLRQQIGNYLAWVCDRCGTLELRGIKREGQQVLQLSLGDVYIPLEAEVYESPEDQRSTGRVMREELAHDGPRSVELNQVLGLGQHIILTGGPGCGKTTVLLHIAWTLSTAIVTDSRAKAKERLGLEGTLPLPIFVPLSAFAMHLRQSRSLASPHDKTLAAFISRYLIEKQTSFDLPDDFFQQLMRDDRTVILLLDGLDEVPDEALRVEVRQAIEELLTGPERMRMRVVVTCRTAAYKDRTPLGKDFREVRVRPLDDQHVEALVRAACEHLYRHDLVTCQAKTDALLQGIRHLEEERSRRLGKGAERLVSSPLLVRMLLVVHFSERRLPEQRAELYMKATDAMLLPEYAPDEKIADRLGRMVGGSREIHREMVQYLAFTMHKRGETQGHEIGEDDLRQVLGNIPLYAKLTSDFIALTRLRGTLLEERLGVYRFIHLAFQEYLAARYLAEIKRGEAGVDGIAAFLEEGPILNSWWREPMLLVTGYLSVTSPQTARMFIRRLAGVDEGAAQRKAVAPLPAVQFASAEAAGLALLEWQSTTSDLHNELAVRLATLFENADLMNQTRPSTRAAAGVVLARLGDPREPVMTLDKMEFCFVPRGPFWMGEGNEQHLNKHLDFDYLMARYPVTVAQFRAFVDASGHRSRDADSLRGALNHPVVLVSWYDSQAFCTWLTSDWQSKELLPKGWCVALPSEAEWEKTARGGVQFTNIKSQISNITQLTRSQTSLAENPNPKRIYPWGDKPDPNCANYGNTNIGTISTVGCFPSGASPYGCEDMSGNVCEWTRSIYRHYPDESRHAREKIAGADKCVLRGSAFYNGEDAGRCSIRDGDYPGGRYSTVGFRVMLLPF